MVKPTGAAAKAVITNDESFNLDWEVALSDNTCELTDPFGSSVTCLGSAANDCICLGTSMTTASGSIAAGEWTEISIDLDVSGSVRSSNSPYKIVVSVKVRENGQSAWETVSLTLNAFVFADASITQSANYVKFPSSIEAGGSILITFQPYDSTGTKILDPLSNQKVKAYLYPGNDSGGDSSWSWKPLDASPISYVECDMVYSTLNSSYTYTTTACTHPDILMAGPIDVYVDLESGGAADSGECGRATLSNVYCPYTDEMQSTRMTNTGTNDRCQCPAGYYLQNNACTACGYGYYRDTAGAELTTTITGFDMMGNPTTTTSTNCGECPSRADGLTTTSTASATALTSCVCPNNMEMTDTSARTCQCPAGTYMEKQKDFDMFGESTGRPDQGTCSSCDMDHYSDIHSTRSDCDACRDINGDENVGTNNTYGASSASDCVCVDSNMIVESNYCVCPAGYVLQSSGGLGYCQACDVGDYSDISSTTPGTDQCSRCQDVDENTSTNGLTAQASSSACVCDDANMVVDSNDGQCKCKNGYENPGPGVCTPCADGYFSEMLTFGEDGNNGQCTSCASTDPNTNTGGNTGSTSVGDCVCNDPNMNKDPVDHMCKCKPGYFLSSGVCTVCPFGSYTDTNNTASACTPCTASDPMTNTTKVGASKLSDCVCIDANHAVVQSGETSTNGNADTGKCACKHGYFWDNNLGTGKGPGGAGCNSCAQDAYRNAFDLPEATADGSGGFTFGDTDTCALCTQWDPNTHSNASTGVASTSGCVCVDPNMDLMPADNNGKQLCGCKAGYYYDAATTSCEKCLIDTYKEGISLETECVQCSTMDANSWTNYTLGASMKEHCICHDENFFVHDPNFYAAGVDPVTYTGLPGGNCLCPAGRFLNGEVCEFCPISTYQSFPGLVTSCRDCATPYNETRANSGTCSRGRSGTECPFSEYFSGISGSTTDVTGADHPDFCGCPQGMFELGHKCFNCDEGHSCFFGFSQYEDFGVKIEEVEVEAGYWRPYPDSSHVFACVHEDSCIGYGVGVGNGTGNFGLGLCEEGHEGPYCENCINDGNLSYAKDSKTGECMLCNSSSGTLAKALVGTMFALAVFLFSYFAYRTARSVVKMQQEATGGVDLSMLAGAEKEEAERKLRVESKKKLREMKGKMAEMKAKQKAYVDKIKKYQKMYKSARTPLKIFISFFQISSGLPKTLEIKFPVNFTQMLHKFNFINLDVAAMFSESCIMVPNFYNELFALTMGPLVAGGVLIIFFLFCRVSKNPMMEVIGDEVFKLFLLGTYLIMPGATVKIFTTFRCDWSIIKDNGHTLNNQDYGVYLKADYNQLCYEYVKPVECSINATTYNEDSGLTYTNEACDEGWEGSYKMTDEYFRWFWYSVIMVFVYPVGITSFYFLVLYFHRHTINPGQDEIQEIYGGDQERAMADAISIREEGAHAAKVKKYAFLYEAYEPRCWYFEIIECMRRLALTGGLIMLQPGTILQICLSMVVCLLSMRVYAGIGPFIKERDDILAEIMQWQIFFTLFGSLLLKIDFTKEQGVTSDQFGFLLLIVNSVGPAMLLGNSFLSGDMKKTADGQWNKGKDALDKHKNKLLCCAGTVGAAIATMDTKKKMAEEKAEEAKKDRRPKKFAVKTQLEAWLEIKKKEEEERLEEERLQKEVDEEERMEKEEILPVGGEVSSSKLPVLESNPAYPTPKEVEMAPLKKPVVEGVVLGGGEDVVTTVTAEGAGKGAGKGKAYKVEVEPIADLEANAKDTNDNVVDAGVNPNPPYASKTTQEVKTKAAEKQGAKLQDIDSDSD